MVANELAIMGHSKKPEKLSQVFRLYRQNNSQEAIARITGLSAKTVSKWLKEIKRKKAESTQILKNLEIRLNEAVTSKAPANEIKDLTAAIENIENRWFNKKE